MNELLKLQNACIDTEGKIKELKIKLNKENLGKEQTEEYIRILENRIHIMESIDKYNNKAVIREVRSCKKEVISIIDTLRPRYGRRKGIIKTLRRRNIAHGRRAIKKPLYNCPLYGRESVDRRVVFY